MDYVLCRKSQTPKTLPFLYPVTFLTWHVEGTPPLLFVGKKGGPGHV